MANLSDYNGVKYDPRIAEANAANQAEQHQAALAQNQASGTVGTYAPNQLTGTQPLTEQGHATQAGMLNQAQANVTNAPTRYGTQTGQITSVPQQPQGGVIAQDRNARLQREGATPEQIAQNQQNLQGIMNANQGISGADLQAEASKRRNQRLSDLGISSQDYEAVNGILSKGGKYAGTENGQAYFLMPDGTKVYSHLNETATKAASDVYGTNFETQIQQEQQQQLHQQSAAILAKQGQPTAEGQATPPAAPTPAAAGASAAFAHLPPEAQFLAPFLQQFQDTIQQGLQDNASLTQSMLDKNKSTYDAVDAQLQDMRSSYKATTEAMQGILQDAKEQNNKQIADQQKAEEDRLAWENYQQRAQASKQQRDAHDSLIANIALRGGFAQDAGVKEVMASDEAYNSRLQDLQVEYGMARTDLAAKFTGLYTENQNKYTSGTLANMKDLQGALERVGMQSIQSTQARNAAEQSLLQNAWKNQTDLRSQLASKNLDVANQIHTIINENRDDKRQQEQLGWQRLEWVSQTYGSNAPPALLDSIGKQLPGVDVRSVASQMTLAEMKKKGASSGGGSAGFSVSQIGGTGKPLTLEQFLSQKEAAALKSGATSFDAKAATEEYKAKLATFEQFNPTKTMQIFNSNLPSAGFSNKEAAQYQANLEDLLKNGKNDEAYYYALDVGKPIDVKSQDSYKMLATARSILPRIADVYRSLAAQGETGPVGANTLGKLDQWNVYKPELDQLVQQATILSDGGALGIQGRGAVSALKQMATSLPNAKYTPDQAIRLINSMATTLDTATTNDLQYDAADHKAIGSIMRLVNQTRQDNPIGPFGTKATTLTPAQQSFLNKF